MGNVKASIEKNVLFDDYNGKGFSRIESLSLKFRNQMKKIHGKNRDDGFKRVEEIVAQE